MSDTPTKYSYLLIGKSDAGLSASVRLDSDQSHVDDIRNEAKERFPWFTLERVRVIGDLRVRV